MSGALFFHSCDSLRIMVSSNYGGEGEAPCAILIPLSPPSPHFPNVEQGVHLVFQTGENMGSCEIVFRKYFSFAVDGFRGKTRFTFGIREVRKGGKTFAETVHFFSPTALFSLGFSLPPLFPAP